MIIAAILTTKCTQLYVKEIFSNHVVNSFNSGSRSSSELSIPTTLMGIFLLGVLGCISSSIFRLLFNFPLICCRNAAIHVDLRRKTHVKKQDAYEQAGGNAHHQGKLHVV